VRGALSRILIVQSTSGEKEEVSVMLEHVLYLLTNVNQIKSDYNPITVPSSYYIVSVPLRTCHSFNRFYDLAVTPEKLCQAEFIELLDIVYENNNLNRLVVDEVGHIFNTLITMSDV